AGGGGEPVWSSDGTRILYRSGNTIISAQVTTSPNLRVVVRDTVNANVGSILTSNSIGYDVARDGRFLGRLTNKDDYQLVAVPNWRTELEQRMASAARR
ncbi:MAG TPA: hypothetical protein VKO87_13690, partial [Gemmatimonadaceae bacterium]|nr:hypothetical protein [Gemmatimonadaceae bacterium]